MQEKISSRFQTLQINKPNSQVTLHVKKMSDYLVDLLNLSHKHWQLNAYNVKVTLFNTD